MNIFKRLHNLEEVQSSLRGRVDDLEAEVVLLKLKVTKPIGEDEKRIFTNNIPASQKAYVENILRVKGEAK